MDVRQSRILVVVAMMAMVCGLMVAGCTKEEKPAGEKPTAKDAGALLGLPTLEIPADNPMSDAKIELGKMLYFDGRLSKNGKISCATCHDPTMAWAEHKPTSEGIGGKFGGRNSPTVINAAYMPAQFWDGRAATLEEQALGPIENPIEMGHEMTAVMAGLKEIPEYVKRFDDVFGEDAMTKENLAKAIAAFERTVLSGNSPYDKDKAGDEGALTAEQKRGMELFMDKADCARCHKPPLFSNGKYYSAGIGMDKEKVDEGRKDVTGKAADRGKFRVPALREVANTGPYFHDGSVADLAEAVRVMGKDAAQVELTEQEAADLVTFLNALSGDFPKTEPPKLP